MVGMGVAEILLMMLLSGGVAPRDIAFGNPVVWLAQSAMARAVPAGVIAWLSVVPVASPGPASMPLTLPQASPPSSPPP